MKIILGSLGVLMLMLLALPSHAKEVYFAKVSDDVTTIAKDWDSLDLVIKSHNNALGDYFKDPQNQNNIIDLTLQPNQEFIIKGGRGSIKEELANYVARKIILGNARNWEVLAVYECYVRRPFPRENTTYIMLRTNYQWGGEKVCTNEYVRLSTSHVVSLRDLHAAIKPPKEN